MKKQWILFIAAISILCGLAVNIHAGEPKLAQTGFQFLTIPTEARAAAMGEAFTAVNGGSMSIFYNPALISRSQAFLDFSLNRNQWIADINHFSGSLSLNPANGRYGTFGFSVFSVDYGEFFGTIVDANPDSPSGYIETGVFSPTAFAFGVAYSKALTDQFSFGFHAKYASQDLGSSLIPDPENEGESLSRNYKEGVMAFDFGTIYYTGFKSLAFGMSVRNFSEEVRFETESFQLPLIFKMGISMNIIDLFSQDSKRHAFLLSVDATHPRAQPEQLKIGSEYTFLNVLALRFGYHYNVDERDVSLGFGLKKDFGRRDGKIAIDYAYTPFGLFENVQRVSFRLSL